jgi:hypothetical protein
MYGSQDESKEELLSRAAALVEQLEKNGVGKVRATKIMD